MHTTLAFPSLPSFSSLFSQFSFGEKPHLSECPPFLTCPHFGAGFLLLGVPSSSWFIYRIREEVDFVSDTAYIYRPLYSLTPHPPLPRGYLFRGSFFWKGKLGGRFIPTQRDNRISRLFCLFGRNPCSCMKPSCK